MAAEKTVRREGEQASVETETELQDVEPGSLVDIILCATSASYSCNSDGRAAQSTASQSVSSPHPFTSPEPAPKSAEATAAPTLPGEAAQPTVGLQAGSPPVARLKRALSEFVIDGIETTIPLFNELIRQPDIANGMYDIHWLERFLGKP